MTRLEKFLAFLSTYLALETSYDAGRVPALVIVSKAFGVSTATDFTNITRGSDTLWKLAAKGYISYSRAFDEVTITPAGREAYAALTAAKAA
jgi:hypothetical protein